MTMHLDSLTLHDFKNIPQARLDLSPRINGFIGMNGMGKSNLLDAVYTLSFTKSFTGVNDALLVRRGAEFAMLKAMYTRRGNPEEVTLGITPGRRKSLRRKGKEYKRMSEHIGLFPLVMVSPRDIDLIRDSGEERRRWTDMVISQGDPRYLEALSRYARALEQRNRLLRDGAVDHTLYEVIEASMSMAADFITRARAAFIDELTPIFARIYAAITEGTESPALAYESQMHSRNATLEALFDGARRHDEAVRHTSVGPHRDDIAMTLDGMPVRRTASEGQCKTFTIALRIAQFEFLRKATSLMPMLLLDDIFDKLDAHRVEAIMKLVSGPGFGQIFITDTNRTHLDEIMAHSAGDYRLWNVAQGEFSPVNRDCNETERS